MHGKTMYGLINIVNNVNPVIITIACIIAIGITNNSIVFILFSHHFTEYIAIIDIMIQATANIHEAIAMQVMIPLTPYMLFLVFVNYIMI